MYDLHTGGAHPMVCFAALGTLLNEKVGARCMGMCIFYIYIQSARSRVSFQGCLGASWMSPGCLPGFQNVPSASRRFQMALYAPRATCFPHTSLMSPGQNRKKYGKPMKPIDSLKSRFPCLFVCIYIHSYIYIYIITFYSILSYIIQCYPSLFRKRNTETE